MSEGALNSLKYFCEVAPEYHVIAAGSLLGVAIRKKKMSAPVGKVRVILNLQAHTDIIPIEVKSETRISCPIPLTDWLSKLVL